MSARERDPLMGDRGPAAQDRWFAFGSSNISNTPEGYRSPLQRTVHLIRRYSSRPGAKFLNYVSQQGTSGTVIAVYLVYVALCALSKIFLKRVNDRMQNYGVVYTGIIWVFWMNVFTILWALIYVLYKRYYEGRVEYNVLNWLSPRSRLASTVGPFSQWIIIAFAFWDQSSATLMTVPTAYMSIPSLNILQNFNLVFTLAVAFLWLGTRFEQPHYAGCVLVVLAGFASIVVELQSGHGFTYKDSRGIEHPTSFMWYIVFVCGTLPLAIGSCYKQKCLKGVDLDVMWSGMWTGIWQMVWGALFFPLNWIPLPDPARHYTPADTPTLIHHGIQCFMGIVPTDDPRDLNCGAEGGSAAYWFSFYIFCNTICGFLILLLTKWMSATWTTVGGVLAQNAAALLSTSELFMGKSAQKLTMEQWLGLALSAVAMWVYNMANEHDKEGHDIRGTQVMQLPTDHVYERVDDYD